MVVTNSIEESYRVKLFLERGCLLKNVMIYNPKHPISLKSYHVKIFNTKESKLICVPKEFIKDQKENKDVLKIEKVKNVILMDVKLSYNEYL